MKKYYQIKIHQNDELCFSTEKSSITSQEDLTYVYTNLKTIFPEKYGYSFEILQWQPISLFVDEASLQ